MKKSLVIKITLLMTAALAIFAVAVGFVIEYNNSRLMNNELIRLTNVYAEYAAVTSPEETADISDKDEDVRITVIAMDGSVIADSLADNETLDNHLYREEIQNALNDKSGKVVVRYSETAKTKLMYYAVKITAGGEEVFVRASMPSVNMNAYLITSVTIIAVLTLVIILAGALIADNLARSTLAPLESVRGSLEKIKDNTYDGYTPRQKYGEINEMLSSIDDVADSLNTTVGSLKKEKLKLQYLTENMAQAVIATGAGDTVVMSNSKAAALFGELNGRHIDACLADSRLTNAYYAADAESVSTAVFDRDKRYYRVSVSAAPYDGEEIYKIILITDITKIKLAELERREFFANCSHELKTPLTVIKGYSELMKNGMVTGEKADKYYDSIIADADKLLKIIDDMLTLSRLDERIGGKPQRIDVLSRVKELAEAAGRADDKNITLSVEGSTDAHIDMNPSDFDALAKNVVENAFKYNKTNGTVKVEVTDGAERVILTVSDSGEGIPANDLPRVTDRFYRVNRSGGEVKGHGLGLAIVKHIAEITDIELGINSEAGVGTTVTLAFKK